MIMKDFLFKNELLSSFDAIIAYGIVTDVETSLDMGSELTFDTWTNKRNWKTSKMTSKYETPLTFTCDILKANCNSTSEPYFDELEIGHIMYWLNSEASEKLVPIYDENVFEGYWLNGSFTSIKMININEKCIGFTLTFEAETPWMYTPETEYDFEGTSDNWEFEILSAVDCHGFYYPTTFSVTCTNACDITIKNDLDDKYTEIKNCVAGEKITLDGNNQIITSSVEHKKLYNDFNYNFPRLKNVSDNTMNTFTVSHAAEVEVNMVDIKKVGVLV